LIDEFEKEINLYIQLCKENGQQMLALAFWKSYHNLMPNLARIARKYLAVQASSAAVERMFSIAGHIFNCKRRRSGVKLLICLVWLKLNEDKLTQLFDKI
jgi:hypothetical protein